MQSLKYPAFETWNETTLIGVCYFSCVNSSYLVIIIKHRLHAKAGETVLIHGASGGVSTCHNNLLFFH